MKLLSDWKAIARKAWSFRLMILAGAFSTAEVVLPMFVDTMPRAIFATLSMIAITGAMIARLIAQQGLTDDAE